MQTIKAFNLVPTLFLLVMLSSCSTVSTDPREGGLLGGIHGVNSGAYKRQLDERQQKLNKLKRSSNELEAEEARIRREIAQYESINKKNQHELANIDQQINLLKKESSSLDKSSGKNQARLEKMKNSLISISRQITTISKKNKINKNPKLERKLRALRREYDLLSKSIHDSR